MNLFALDTETTGLDPKKHEIIELAFSIIINGVKHCSMELYMRPEKWGNISQKALDVNGWTVERLNGLPDRECAWRTLVNYIVREHERQFITVEWSHTGSFDYGFLRELWNGLGAPFDFKKYFPDKLINVKDISKKKIKVNPHSLKNAAKTLRIPVDERQLHGAAYDRDLMVEVYRRLGGGF